MFCLSDINMTENYQIHATASSNDYFNLDAKVVQFEGTPEADAGDNRLVYLMTKNTRFGQTGYAPLKYIKLDNGNDRAKMVADMLPDYTSQRNALHHGRKPKLMKAISAKQMGLIIT